MLPLRRKEIVNP